MFAEERCRLPLLFLRKFFKMIEPQENPVDKSRIWENFAKSLQKDS
jgi:hypothetical protein